MNFIREIQSIGDALGLEGRFLVNWGFDNIMAAIREEHQLAPFFQAVRAEYERGEDKYGPWSKISPKRQKRAVKSECLEWEAASLKDDGGEREMQELTHLANVAGKRYEQLTAMLEGK
jgi:hypothetical protein